MPGRTFEIVGASFGLASYDPRSAHAPAALRKLGLIERLGRAAKDGGPKVLDAGDIELGYEPSEPAQGEKLKYLDEVMDFGRRLMDRLGEIYERGHMPMLLGGDHSISIASIAADSKYLRSVKPGSRLGVLWVDAHADINTPETTPTGNIHGMPIAHSLGLGDSRLANFAGFSPKLDPSCLVYIGLRDVDPGERRNIKDLGITAFSMKEVDILGIGKVCEKAFEQLERECDAFVISFDLDVCDPWIAPGVGTPVRGGLTFRESHLIMELAAQSEKLLSVELVEYNPELDQNNLSGDIAIGLLESSLGKSIL